MMAIGGMAMDVQVFANSREVMQPSIQSAVMTSSQVQSNVMMEEDARMSVMIRMGMKFAEKRMNTVALAMLILLPEFSVQRAR